MAGDLVFLTGASGFLGFITLVNLLKSGYNVRAAVRSQAKADKILAAPSIKALKPTSEQLSFVIVPDMTADHAYDEAVKGVKYILHEASPIPSFGDDTKAIAVEDQAKMEETFIKTAVRSDLGMLQSAQKAGTVKRLVVTSSVVAITPFKYYMGEDLPGETITDKTRIPLATGPFRFEFEAYSAGKAAALQHMESWIQTEKPGFDLIVVFPGWIFGRDELITDVENHKKGSTNSVLVNFLIGGKNPSPYNGDAVLGEDVARVHVAALNPAIAGNQAFIASQNMIWGSAQDTLRKYYADAVKAGKLSVDGEQGTLELKVDGTRTEEVFGFKFAPFETAVRQVADQYLELEAKA